MSVALDQEAWKKIIAEIEVERKAEMTDTTTNTPEPVAWVKSSEWDDAKKKRQSFNGWRQNYGDCDMRLYPESALQAERERAEKEGKLREETADKLVAVLRRAEKAEAELAALKEALRELHDAMSANYPCAEQGVAAQNAWAERQSAAMSAAAHLLKD